MWYAKNAEYNKLVRDKIPDIIQTNWATPITHIASEEEFSKELKAKLTEEVQEYLISTDPKELADILEVVYALAENQNITKDELEEIRHSRYKIHTKINLEDLKIKLKQKSEEYLISTDPKELADILEVVYALAENQNITKKELEELRLSKQAKNWAFKKKIILEKTIESIKDNI